MAGGGGGEKTEKPTPKRLQEARKKGQGARSNDLNGAVVMLARLITLGATRPSMLGHIRNAMTSSLAQTADPSVVSLPGLGSVLLRVGSDAALAVAPVALACAVAAIAVNAGQSGVRVNIGLLKP